jgi:transcriptional regulator with XRE-family HTH domain
MQRKLGLLSNFAGLTIVTQGDALLLLRLGVMMDSPEYRLARVADFSANLRFLCDQRGSISQICRKAKINRQQFNKYLSGKHMPSPANIRVISDHFGLGPDMLFCEHKDFCALIDGNFFDTFSRLRQEPQVLNFLSTLMGTPENVEQSLIGVYDRYHYSSIYPRRILKSAFCIYRGKDLLQHTYLERFPSYDNPLQTAYTFKYHGFTLPIEGRVFTIDFESKQRNELTFGVLTSVQRNTKRFMFGITCGIAATMFRQPFATRLALHYRRPGYLARAELAAATTLDMNDASIPREVREYLGDKPDMVIPG